jgi:hypothetical protein
MTSWTLRACWAIVLLVSLGSLGWADTTASNFSVKGATAVATFEAADSQDPCLVNTIIVVASDSMEKLSPEGQPSSTVRTTLIVVQEDVCLGITLLSGEGATAQQSLRIAGELSTATLDTTVMVLDNILTGCKF